MVNKLYHILIVKFVYLEETQSVFNTDLYSSWGKKKEVYSAVRMLEIDLFHLSATAFRVEYLHKSLFLLFFKWLSRPHSYNRKAMWPEKPTGWDLLFYIDSIVKKSSSRSFSGLKFDILEYRMGGDFPGESVCHSMYCGCCSQNLWDRWKIMRYLVSERQGR